MNHLTTRVMLSAAIAITPVAVAPPAVAATFTVTSKIYEGANLGPAAEHQILFDEGLVYDLPKIDSRYVTVYDFSQARVFLLDRQTQNQTTVGTADLVKVTAQARAAAKTPQQQEQLGLTADVEPSNRVIGYSIRCGNTERHTTTQTPNDPTIAADYGQFADLALRLNLLRPPGPPPFARMTLNDYITRKGEVPLETTLTLRSGNSVTEYRSTHILGALTAADQKKIDKVRDMLALYRKISPKEFLKAK